MKHKIYGNELPNIPFEERPNGCDSPIWRYSNNPIINRNPFENASRVFNSAVIPYKGEFIGVFRADTKSGVPYLFLGHSKDGIKFNFDVNPIVFHDKDGNELKVEYAYDPRLVELEGVYYIIFCTSLHGPTLGIGRTKDFKDFELIDNPFLPFNRNGVLFPRKINGNFVMLSRPSDSGHTPFGDIFLSESPDMVYWGKHRHVMGRSN
jgi:beta-1,4-mannooligosaccharide/beta-1,4-mannosyl-N-acetylglucosamine phosphorylase